MKLIGKLKEDVAKAQSLEEAKQLIENAGMELTDEELGKISGGGTTIFDDRQPKYDKDGNFIGWTTGRGGNFK